MPQSTEGEAIELLAFELVKVNIQVRKADVDFASSDGLRPLYETGPKFSEERSKACSSGL